MERFSQVLATAWEQNNIFLNAYLSVSAVVFCKQFLAYAVHIDESKSKF